MYSLWCAIEGGIFPKSTPELYLKSLEQFCYVKQRDLSSCSPFLSLLFYCLLICCIVKNWIRVWLVLLESKGAPRKRLLPLSPPPQLTHDNPIKKWENREDENQTLLRTLLFFASYSNHLWQFLNSSPCQKCQEPEFKTLQTFPFILLVARRMAQLS